MFSLKGKKAFIAGIGDDQGYGWAIAKVLAEAGVDLLIGTWAPLFKIFTHSWESGKFDSSRRLSDNTLMKFLKIYPLDASFDQPEDLPSAIREHKRYQGLSGYTIAEVAQQIEREFQTIDFIVHSLANAPEVKRPLLETSRKGYLDALSSSSYSFVSLLQQMGPFMSKTGSAIALSYIAAEKAIPGYGGGMNAAKAALESDTKMLAWEAGRRWGIRVNLISAGPLPSRAAKAIGFIQKMIAYSEANAPLLRKLVAEDVGKAALFLFSSLANAITGVTLYVDNGLHAMGVAVDSSSLYSSSP